MRSRLSVVIALLSLASLATPATAEDAKKNFPDRPRVRVSISAATPVSEMQFLNGNTTANTGRSIFDLLAAASHNFTRATIVPQGDVADAYIISAPSLPNINPGDSFTLYRRTKDASDGPGSGVLNVSVDTRLFRRVWLRTGWQLSSLAKATHETERDYINVTRVDYISILPNVTHVGMDRRYAYHMDEFKTRGHTLSAALKYDPFDDMPLSIAPVAGVQLWLAGNRYYTIQRDARYTHFLAEELVGGFPGGMTNLRGEEKEVSGENSITRQHSWQGLVGVDIRIGGHRKEDGLAAGLDIQVRRVVGDRGMTFLTDTPSGVIPFTSKLTPWSLAGGLVFGF